jgi:transposase
MLQIIQTLPPTELDQQVFAATVRADHHLRRVLEIVDFGRCRPLMASCYSPAHGRPALDPVLLLKLEYLEFHYRLSDREVIEQARVNMAYRYFLNLSLNSPLPHHTSLTYFRERLGAETHQRVFDDVVAQAREHGLVKDRLRLKDATHIIANIAIPSTIRLVAETRDRLLTALRPLAPEQAAAETARAESIHLTTADAADKERLLQRVTHLQTLVAWTDQWRENHWAERTDAAEWMALEEALRLAHKVLCDREDDANDKLVSLHDPEARTGKHGDWYTGYSLDVSMDADSEIITAVNVLPANGDEAADARTLIDQEEQAQGNDVRALSIDGIGFKGTMLRDLTDPQGPNLEVFVPPAAVPETKFFPPERFSLNVLGDAVTCPGGQETRHRKRSCKGTGWQYRFARKTCAACPLQPQCVPKLEGARGRTVVKNDYEAEYRAAREKARTPEYAAVRRQHPRIERKLAELVRRHGARRARYRGQWRVRLQALLTTMVVNVKRLTRLLQPPPALPVRADLVTGG